MLVGHGELRPRVPVRRVRGQAQADRRHLGCPGERLRVAAVACCEAQMWSCESCARKISRLPFTTDLSRSRGIRAEDEATSTLQHVTSRVPQARKRRCHHRSRCWFARLPQPGRCGADLSATGGIGYSTALLLTTRYQLKVNRTNRIYISR